MVTYLDPHTVSAQYVSWRIKEQSVRAFLRATNSGMDDWMRQRWNDAEEEASATFDPDYNDEGLPAEIFERAVGVWPTDYFWQLSSAVVKDACALYEMFLEHQADEVLRRAGARLTKLSSEDSWRWNDCTAFYAHYVGVDVRPPAIEAALWIRNKMTHLRDELRTTAGRAELNAHLATLGGTEPATSEETALGLVEHPPYMTHGVHLSQLQTWRIIDVLANQVGIVAHAAFPYIYRTKTSKFLVALANHEPLPISNFPTSKLFTYT